MCLVELQLQRLPRFLLRPSSVELELQFVLGILLHGAAQGGIADAPGGEVCVKQCGNYNHCSGSQLLSSLINSDVM